MDLLIQVCKTQINSQPQQSHIKRVNVRTYLAEDCFATTINLIVAYSKWIGGVLLFQQKEISIYIYSGIWNDSRCKNECEHKVHVSLFIIIRRMPYINYDKRTQ